MSDDFLSQEEIDSLMSKSTDVNGEEIEQLDSMTSDIIGEIGNISMSTAATTLSSILNHQVLITTPKVSLATFEKILEECEKPKVVATVRFKEGLKGDNLLMLDVSDATIIADLMMGGDGSGGSENLSELELSAVSEAMNQMIGSAATSMSTMFNKPVDIEPPIVELWDSINKIDDKFLKDDGLICRISFDLTVDGLIESEIMQFFTLESVEDIVRIMMGDDSSEEIVETKEEAVEEIEYEAEEEEDDDFEQYEQKTYEEKVTVQKPVFSELKPSEGGRNNPRNLDLIMDVPLEFSVVLGKTQKSIKDVLSFSSGSIVELNKLAVDPLEIYVNGKLIAHGEVVVINENFGIRITNILSKKQRVHNLK